MEASQRYGIHPYLLWSIAKKESGFKASAIGKNKDGSEDIGIMQINSWWLEPRKSQSSGKRLGDYGITRSALFDPCTNIHAGAWVLAQNIQSYGNTWKAVGAYNAITPWKQDRYAKDVKRILEKALQENGL